MSRFEGVCLDLKVYVSDLEWISTCVGLDFDVQFATWRSIGAVLNVYVCICSVAVKVYVSI
jgi:hypothetical protein